MGPNNLVPIEWNSTLTIPAGSSFTGLLDTVDSQVIGMFTPPAWDAADLSMFASIDGSTIINVLRPGDTTFVNIIAAAAFIVNAYYSLQQPQTPYDMSIFPRYIGVQSLSGGAARNQTANRVFTFQCRPRHPWDLSGV